MVQRMALALQDARHGPSNNMGTAKGFLLSAQALCKCTGGNQDTGFNPQNPNGFGFGYLGNVLRRVSGSTVQGRHC